MLVTSICVCGAGTMGSGIAQLAARGGYLVVLYDVSEQMLLKGKMQIETAFEKLVEKGKIDTAQRGIFLQKIKYTSNINDCKVDLVIEAIVEKLEIKQQLFAQLSQINTSHTIYATNTSSISVTLISKGFAHKEKFVGMHFFNPAPLMKLVEVIKTIDTSEGVVKSIIDVCKQLQKVPVVCKDSPGFIVNRVARQYYIEAMKLVEDGKATIETVDAVMEGCGFKMGPFKLMDLIGLDINYGVSNIVYEALEKPIRLQPSPLQKTHVDAGELGKKTGKGFYKYL